MSSWNPFKRKSSDDLGVTSIDPSEMSEPTDYESFMKRGWIHHARGNQDQAESDFRRALIYSPESMDAYYALGLVMKSMGNKDEAVKLFNKTMEMIKQGKIADQSQSEMMRRLTLGHINELTTGDWNLEDEIWHQSR
ncbi:MAG: tetratricopeptide repeat protein [Chloroflexota bacterium]|nr:MAG: tetratricopeptide repeat protein [Chloroflexota bacterium]